ncbi:hypothetical protein NFC81_03075 [Salinispirillum sp. LH 10-3-1]|uniref:Uncharacterized protein n=1 Tax=Salinispirillum sp. LH 10-3-1 TaxID=2952525 RepID=A0AB38YI95_9GAMM
MPMLQWLPNITTPRTWLHLLAAFLLVVITAFWQPAIPTAWPMAEALHHMALVCLLYWLGRLFLLRHLAFGAAVLLYALPLLVIAAPLGHFTYAFAPHLGVLSALMLIAIAVADFRWNARPRVLPPATALVLLGVSGILLLPASQAAWPWLSAFSVPNALLPTLTILAGLWAAFSGRTVLLWLLAITLGAFSIGLFAPIVGWQYVVDPFFLLLAGLACSNRTLRA